ncbi:MAG: lipopolysaccharide biosynthesis protein [Saprospiraceae bacterium]|nr:lipopolysaccharide biosynthesis protein [Saprospiraceae bacterium]
MMNIGSKAIVALVWNVFSSGLVQFIQVVISLILARLLTPELFGAYAILIMINAFCQIIIESGLVSSLIRTKTLTIRDYSTVFTFQMIISIALYFLIYFASEQISIFFNSIVPFHFIKITSLILIVKAFYSLHEMKLIRDLNFKLIATLNIISNVLAGAIAIYLALHDYGILSLIYMLFIQSSVYGILLWIMVDLPVRCIIDIKSLKGHLKFGSFLMLSGILDSIFQQVYQVIIGKYFLLSQLAFYNKATTYSQLPIQMIVNPVNSVVYPFLANFSEDIVKLKLYYKKILITTFFLLTPIMVVSAILMDNLILCLLTDKWIEIAPYFRILALVAILYPVHYYNLNILKVLGKTKLFFALDVVKKAIIVISIFVVLPFGLEALLWSQVVNSIIFLFLNSILSKRLIDYALIDQFLDLLPVMLLSGITFAFCIFLKSKLIIIGLSNFLVLLCCGCLSLMVYFSLAYLFKLNPVEEIKNIKKMYDTGY